MGEGLPAKFPQRADLWVGRFCLIREVQQMPRDLFESVLDLKNASFFCALPAVSRVGNRQSGPPEEMPHRATLGSAKPALGRGRKPRGLNYLNY